MITGYQGYRGYHGSSLGPRVAGGYCRSYWVVRGYRWLLWLSGVTGGYCSYHGLLVVIMGYQWL